jgi:signal peptidase I
MKKLKRKVVSAFIVMIFAFVSTVGVTYAWWNMLTQTESETITLGEGDELIVSETTTGSGILIPDTQTATGNEVTSITYVYEVSINNEALEAGATHLTVNIENVLIGGSSDYSSLVNFNITNETYTFESTGAIAVSVKVTLTEPPSQTVYDAIKNKDIIFDIVFTIA